jgi:hypothetical protein
VGTCEKCGLPVPSKENEIPCSEYHVRCVRCMWPIAKKLPNGGSLLDENGICNICRGKQ